MASDWTDKHVQRRIINFSAFRLDGLADMLPRARGASVFDIGCNRGAVCHDFVLAGATVVHGCDLNAKCIETANEWFADIRSVNARFEVVDLAKGPAVLEKAFGKHYQVYDIMLMLAVYHKLRRVMKLEDLLQLVDNFAQHTSKYFVWRGSREEKTEFEPVLLKRGFKQVAWSEICLVKLPDFVDPIPQPAAIWSRDHP